MNSDVPSAIGIATTTATSAMRTVKNMTDLMPNCPVSGCHVSVVKNPTPAERNASVASTVRNKPTAAITARTAKPLRVNPPKNTRSPRPRRAWMSRGTAGVRPASESAGSVVAGSMSPLTSMAQPVHATSTTSTMIIATSDSNTSGCHACAQNDFFAGTGAGTVR